MQVAVLAQHAPQAPRLRRLVYEHAIPIANLRTFFGEGRLVTPVPWSSPAR